MIEYLYNAIRASAGTEVTISAKITDDNDIPITDECVLLVHENDKHIEVEGVYIENTWFFTIPAEVTAEMNGRYWYCFKHGDVQLSFKQPIYFV